LISILFQIEYYEIAGTGYYTPHGIQYTEPIETMQDLITADFQFVQVDGDGTVVIESALNSTFKEVDQATFVDTHMGLVQDVNVMNQCLQWMGVDYEAIEMGIIQMRKNNLKKLKDQIKIAREIGVDEELIMKTAKEIEYLAENPFEKPSEKKQKLFF